VRVLDCPATGKAGALNTGVAHATHDIVVFADARQRFDTGVVADLVSVFFDDRVGAVSGELVIDSSGDGDFGESVGLYWAYEKLIRRMESRADSVVGATGSIYAIRRSLYVPLEERALLDDFLVPMRIVLQGYRVVFNRAAQAHDTASSTASQEFDRKVRTLAGNFQALAMEPRLLDPWRNRIFFQLISHKLCRLAVPYFCVLALVASALVSDTLYRVAFFAQLVFYLLGGLSRTPLRSGPIGRLVRLSSTFVVLNAAAVAGLWVWATGRANAAWKKG